MTSDPKVTIYTRKACGYCTAALALLNKKHVAYKHIDATGDQATRAWLVQATGQQTVPQIFIGEQSIGGFSELSELDDAGELDRLLAA